jgi:hypothetical protein
MRVSERDLIIANPELAGVRALARAMRYWVEGQKIFLTENGVASHRFSQ